jgi:hypothetical protein
MKGGLCNVQPVLLSLFSGFHDRGRISDVPNLGPPVAGWSVARRFNVSELTTRAYRTIYYGRCSAPENRVGSQAEVRVVTAWKYRLVRVSGNV